MRLKVFIGLFLTLSVAVSVSLAQSECPTLVEQALQAISDNCSSLQRNTVCYGFNQVQASFLSDVADDYFTKPSDRADLIDLKTIKTTSITLGGQEWGVAVLSLQANVPNTLPGQAVTFVLLGDAELENGVSPESAYVAPDPITVVVKTNANVRSGPGLNFNVIGTAAVGAEYLTDARSEDAQWVRVIYGDQKVAWMNRIVLADNPAIDALPVPSEDTRATMQAFYLRTGIGRTECEQAPQNSLMVQGPKNFQVDLTVNGAKVSISSTVIFEIVGDNQDQMKITVLDGKAVVTPNITDAETITINEGFSSEVCLSDPNNLGVDGETNDRVASCNPSEPEPIQEALIDNTFCALQQVPNNILNYAVDLQCPGDPEPTPTPIPATRAPQQPQNTPVPTPVGGGVDCSNFVVIDPTFEVTYAGQLFQWTQAAGADEYAINLYNVNGEFLTGAFTGKATAIILDVGELLPGGAISWNAVALKNGEVKCVTARTGNLYVGEEIAITKPGFYARLACSNPYDVEIFWENASSADTIFFYFNQTDPEGLIIGSGSSGSGLMEYEYCGDKTSKVTTSSGLSYNLPQANCGFCPPG